MVPIKQGGEKVETFKTFFSSIINGSKSFWIVQPSVFADRDWGSTCFPSVITRILKDQLYSSAFLSFWSIQCCRNQKMLKAGHLLTIYQEYWESGKVFDGWKPANIIPVPKNGAREDSRNYRPTILTSATGKVWRRLSWVLLKGILRKKVRHRMDTQRECSALVISSLSMIKSPVGRRRERDGCNNCGFW